MSSAPANHDPALSQSPNTQSNILGSSNSINNLTDLAGQLSTQSAQGNTPFDSKDIMSILRSLPNVFSKLTEQGNLKEDAAQTLSNLSQATFPPQHQLPVQYPGPGPGGLNHLGQIDSGPSTHPRGPPNLGQLGSVPGVGGMQGSPQMDMSNGRQEMEEGGSDGDEGGGNHSGPGGDGQGPNPSSGSGGKSRGSRSATMGSDEWSRQRKDNHKEVERRRRGNINDGINELGRIVPNGTGEKAKGAILSRAVQYIHHLKENEARNIEKWTLEKLLMDQAMGDQNAQLEELKRLIADERGMRERAEAELAILRGAGVTNVYNADGQRREGEEGDEGRLGKRQRVDM